MALLTDSLSNTLISEYWLYFSRDYLLQLPLECFTVKKEQFDLMGKKQCDNQIILEQIKDRLLSYLRVLSPTAHNAYLKKVPRLKMIHEEHVKRE